ncbi:RHS repeat protein [Actinocrinis puniceicyclus]|uniref:RHS repeat protein n=1 Tax=Actinocrinis puniceicyclus TaxID=977794 RepID=A0A8J7WVC9_9ACTN|nr:RHS repeat protein [Actinocrinis puniceicyclus]
MRTLSGGRKTWTFGYDAYDRLIEATTPSGARWCYRYDPLGRRTAKRHLGSNGASGPVRSQHWSAPHAGSTSPACCSAGYPHGATAACSTRTTSSSYCSTRCRSRPRPQLRSATGEASIERRSSNCAQRRTS